MGADLTQSIPSPPVLGFVLRQQDTWRETGRQPLLCVSCVYSLSPEYETQPRQLAKNLPT